MFLNFHFQLFYKWLEGYIEIKLHISPFTIVFIPIEGL